MHEPEPEVNFDERRWEKIETLGNGYSPRTGHTVVAHENSLYVFGGTDRRRRQQDLFQYDIETRQWTKVNALGTLPPRRSGALGIVHGTKMYIFGGYDGRDGNYFNDLFYFNFETRSWNEMPSRPGERPEARTDHIMTLCDGSIYIFGGYDGHTRYQNMYRYIIDQTKWELIAPIGVVLPSRRFGHSGVVHQASKKMVVFGGWDGKDTLNDLYSFNLDRKEWRNMITTGPTPPHRYRHTAVIFDDSMFVFGGVDKQHCRYNDLQRLDLRTNVWSKVATKGFIPSSRTFHRAVVVGNLMYLLGGYDGTDRLHDLYSIHVGTLTPASLVSICSKYARDHYRQILKHYNFAGVPNDILSTQIWRRDLEHNLRGKCRRCTDEKCRVYELSRTPKNCDSNSIFSNIWDVHSNAPSIDECVCGHSNSEHELIKEKMLFRPKRRITKASKLSVVP